MCSLATGALVLTLPKMNPVVRAVGSAVGGAPKPASPPLLFGKKEKSKGPIPSFWLSRFSPLRCFSLRFKLYRRCRGCRKGCSRGSWVLDLNPEGKWIVFAGAVERGAVDFRHITKPNVDALSSRWMPPPFATHRHTMFLRIKQDTQSPSPPPYTHIT